MDLLPLCETGYPVTELKGGLPRAACRVGRPADGGPPEVADFQCHLHLHIIRETAAAARHAAGMKPPRGAKGAAGMKRKNVGSGSSKATGKATAHGNQRPVKKPKKVRVAPGTAVSRTIPELQACVPACVTVCSSWDALLVQTYTSTREMSAL